MEVKYILQPNTEESAIEAEYLRYNAYGIKATREDLDDYFINEIKEGKILVFICLADNIPIAGCYVSDSFNKLYIDYLFVIPEYRDRGLHIGRKLLSFILENKTIVENHFNKELNYSELISTNDKTYSIYQKLGYEKKTPESDTMQKKLD